MLNAIARKVIKRMEKRYDYDMRAVLTGNASAMNSSVSLAYHYADTLLNSRTDIADAREAVRATWGDKGLIDLAMNVQGARLYPMMKHALGFALECQRVSIQGRWVDVTKKAVRRPIESLTLCQHDMGCGGSRHMRGALIAQGREIEAVQERLAGPEQPGRDRHVQLVDEPRFEVLADRRHTAADLHIPSLRCLRRPFQRLAGTARDKVEHRAAFHLDRRAGVMRQHKYRAVVRRVLPPPAMPGVIGPGTTNRAEHVASHDPRADALPKPRRDIVIDAGSAAALTIDALERAGRDEPIVQRFTTDAEGILASLERARAIAVERDRKVVHAYTGH